MKKVFELKDLEFPIKVEQYANADTYRVTHGLQVSDRLSYGAATKALGEAIFHALACAGRFDPIDDPDEG